MMLSNILLQLSDTHVLPKGTLLAGEVDTGATFQNAIKRIQALSVKPKGVVITGDLVEDGRFESYTYVRDMMCGLDVPVYLMAGNHDNRENLLQAFPDMLNASLMRLDGFIQYAVDVAGVQLVMLDTMEPAQPYGILCAKRLQWLDACLSKYPHTPTIVAMHHPPFKTGMFFMDQLGLHEGAQELEQILLKHPQVKRLICGHQHRGSIQSFANRIATVAPSASHQLNLQLREDDPLGYTGERPVGVLHMWQTGDEGNIISHLLNLTLIPNSVSFQVPL